MMKKEIATIILSACALSVCAKGDGQTAYNILDIPMSAHSAALGGENISLIEDDASLSFLNPALLNNVSHRTLSLGYMNYLSGSAVYNAHYTHVTNDKMTVGGAIQYASYGSMKHTDAEGRLLGEFNPSDIVMAGMLSYPLATNLIGGVTAKFVYSKIDSYVSTAAAVDLGINFYHPEKDLSLSAVVRNLGGQLSAYNDDYESIPLDVSFGGSYKPDNFPFRFSLTFADLNHWDYSFLRHSVIGVDLVLSNQFYIAGGYNLQREHTMKVMDTDETESSHGAGLSIGAGLLLDKFKLNIGYCKYHVSASSILVNAAFAL